jgi:hypothetical protein
MDKERRIESIIVQRVLFLLGIRDSIGLNRQGFDSQPVKVHFAQAVLGSLPDHQNVLGLKAQEPAAESVKAYGIGRGHDRFGAAQFARSVRPVFHDKGRGVGDAEVRLPDEVQVRNALGKMVHVPIPSQFQRAVMKVAVCGKGTKTHHVLEGTGIMDALMVFGDGNVDEDVALPELLGDAGILQAQPAWDLYFNMVPALIFQALEHIAEFAALGRPFPISAVRVLQIMDLLGAAIEAFFEHCKNHIRVG